MISSLQALGSISDGMVINNKMLIKSFASLTPNKIADIAATNGLSQSTLAATLKSAGYTKQQRVEVCQQYNTIKAKQSATAATNAQTTATTAATAATGGFAAALKGLWVTFTGFLATPIGQITAIATLLIGAKVAADKLGLSAEGAANKFEEAKNTFADAASELNNISSELDNTKSKIEELEKLAANGQLIPDQEAELNDLKKTNAELQRKYEIQKKLAEIAQNENEAAAVNKYERTRYDSAYQKKYNNTNEFSIKMTGAEYIEDLVAGMTSVQSRKVDLGEALKRGEIDAKKYEVQLEKLNAEYADYEQKATKVVAEQQEIAESIDDTKGPLHDIKMSILNAINAWLLFDATEQEVLGRLRSKATSDMKSAAADVAAAGRTVARNANDSETGKAAIAALTSSAEKFKTNFPAYVSEAIKLGYIADDSTESILKLANALQSASDAPTAHWIPDLTAHIASMKTVEENIGSLSDALGEFRDNGIVSYKTIEELSAAFGNLSGDEFESFIQTATDSSSSLAEVQGAVNKLAAAYLNSTEFLNSMTEETIESTIASLKHLGVTNAKTVVMERFAIAQMEAALEADGLAKATWDVAEKQLLATGATESNISALQRLRQEQYNAQVSATDFATASYSVVSSLIAQGKAAGVAGDNLAKLKRIEELQDYVIDGRMSKEEYAAAAEKLAEEAKADVSALQAELSLPSFNVKVKYPKSTKKETDKNKEAFEEKYNAMKHELDMEKITIEQFYAWLNGNDGYKKHFSDRAKYADEWRKYEKECYDLERQITTEAFNDKYNIMKHELDMEKITLEQFYAWLNGNDGYKKYFSDLTRYADEWRKYEKECLDYDRSIADAILKDLDHDINMLERASSKSYVIMGQLSSLPDDLKVVQKDYEDVLSEAASLGVDLSRTIYGNIDLNNRQILEWTESNLEKYKSAIMSWEDANSSWESVSKDMLGTISTVMGGSMNFEGLEIAYTPLLQTDHGAVLLTKETVLHYINSLLDDLRQRSDGWNTEDLLSLDFAGMEIDGQHIRNLIADVGDMAIKTGEAMHFAGADGAVELLRKEVERLSEECEKASSATVNQVRTESQLISKYREKQSVIRRLIDSQIAYLKAQGLSDSQISNNDTLQEYLELWYQVQDSIDDVVKTVNEEIADGLETILDMTIEIVKKEKEDEIDALNDIKDAYSDIIEQRREMLRMSEQERQYDDEKNEKLRQLEKIEARLAALGQDDSREARLEEASLQEEKYKLQKELNDLQNNHWLDSVEAKLDEELEKWEDTQDSKIDEIEDFVNDELKLRAEAISRLENMDDKLYDTLLDHAVNYCDMSRYEFQKLWDDALAAAEKYGSFVGAMDFLPAGDKETEASSIIAEMERNRASYAAATSDSERAYYDNENLRLGAELAKVTGRNVYRDRNGYWWIDDQYLFDYGLGTGNENSSVSRKNAAKVSDIVNNMKEYGKKWNANDPNRGQIHQVVAEMADSLERYGVYTEYDSASGKWIITKDNNNPSNKNKWLYEVYHQGGVVGFPTIKQNEHLSLLEHGEMILTQTHQNALDKLIQMSKKVAQIPSSVAGMFNSTDNSQSIKIEAPLYITSDMSEGKILSVLKKHSRLVANEVARVVAK